LIISPFDIPFFKEEPFLSLDAENMKILVQAAYNEDLFIVPHRLSSEKLFWLL